MANVPLKSLKFPGLGDKYTVDSLTPDIKSAILQIASKVAYIDEHGQDYYDDLYNALYPPASTFTVTNALTNCTTSNAAVAATEGDPYSAIITADQMYSLVGATVSVTMGGTDITSIAYSNGAIDISTVTGAIVITIAAVAVTVESISAGYTQSGTVYDTDSLDSLKPDLVVTATYSDSSTATVPSADYTLSGTLTAGTSTITVSYGGQTDTFNVTVTDVTGGALYYWDLTSGLTDLANGNVATVIGATQSSQGLLLDSATDYAVFPNVFGANRRIEIDVANIDRKGNTHGRFVIYNRGSASSPSLDAGLMYRMSQAYWALYTTTWISTSFTDATIFNGKTLVIELDANKAMTVEVDDTTIVATTSAINIASDDNSLYLGSNDKSLYNLLVTGIRVYEEV